jgi:hypothetical protein
VKQQGQLSNGYFGFARGIFAGSGARHFGYRYFDACVTLYESEGGGPDHTFGAGVYAIDHQRLRVICRAARNDYPAARSKAEAVRGVLGAVRNTTLSGVSILTILATSEVYPLTRDGDDRTLIGCDFTIWLG